MRNFCMIVRQKSFLNNRFIINTLLHNSSIDTTMVLGEALKLVVRFSEEDIVWSLNNRFISEDNAPDDYKTGTWSMLFEEGCRLPRSRPQIEKLQKDGKYGGRAYKPEFYVRVDVFKLHAKTEPNVWNSMIEDWKKWGVHKIFREYLSIFFPGREAEAKAIGLISDDIEQDSINTLVRNDDKNLLDLV
eukprot:794365_1